MPSSAHHPWRRFAGFTDWRLRWTDELEDGVWGRTLFSQRTVLLAHGLDQAERRCTIAHETQHIIRGPLPPEARDGNRRREELAIDRLVGRLLIPDVQVLGEALTWARGDRAAAADELWVDTQLLEVRLSTLTPAESAWLGARLAGPLL